VFGSVNLAISRTSPAYAPYDTLEISGLAKWMAVNEILDPADPEALFEPIARRGLVRGRLKMPFRNG
jgi:hypothetical protein